MNLWKGLRGLPSDMWVLFGTTLINRSGTMALPFLSLYITQNLGYSSSDAADVLLLYGVASMFTAPFAGRLADAVGERRMMLGSLSAGGLVMGVMPWIDRMTYLAGAVVLWAVISESFRPASLAVITKLVQPEQRKAAFAVNRLAINLGMSIGPAVGGFLVMVSYPMLFWVNGATALAAAIFLYFAPWKFRDPDVHPPHTSDGRHFWHILARDRHLAFFLVALIPVVIVFFQHNSTLPLFMVKDLKLEEWTYGAQITINTVMIFFIEVALNMAMAHWPHRRAMALGSLLTGIGFGVMGWADGFAMMTVATVIWTFGEMILLPGAAAYVADIAPPSLRGTYMGIFQMSFGFCFSVGPWLGLHLLDSYGARALWLTMFVLGGLSTLMMWNLTVKTSVAKPENEA